MGLVLGDDLQECEDITWRVSDCEELVGVDLCHKTTTRTHEGKTFVPILCH